MEIDLGKIYNPSMKQRYAHGLLKRYILFGGAMRCGKSVWGVMFILILLLKYPGNVALICRWELASLKRTTLVTLFKFWPSALIKSHNKADGRIELYNGSVCWYMGLKPSAGFSALDRLKSMELGCFFIDEVTEAEKQYFDLLKTRMSLVLPDGTQPRYRGLFACNPEPGWVRDTFIDKVEPGHVFVPALPTDNPYLDPAYVAELRRTLPPELVAKYLEGDWNVMTDEMYVFPYMWIKAAMDRSLEKALPIEAGLDVGAGGDETVMAVREGPVVKIKHRSKYKNTMTTVGLISTLLDQYAGTNAEEVEYDLKLKVDTVGVGKGVYDRLSELEYPVEAFVGGAKARNPERFMNARAEAHWGLRDRLENGNIDLPDMQELLSELSGIKYEIRSDRVIKIESKKDSKTKSPNIAESVIYSLAESTQRQPRLFI